jgi:hypothetical protein
MDNRLSNDYISGAIDELIVTIGVKEQPPIGELLGLLHERNTEQCVKEIALHLGLPVKINLSYVPKRYSPDSSITFQSRALSATDSAGRGTAGITGQVSIPENLPLYGDPALENCYITVKVSEECYKEAETLIAIMAHELSHLLLYSLRHPQKNNEVYTDLIPLLLGFSKIIEDGRKNIKTTTTGNLMTTTTTTYGYLTDAQFRFARNKIEAILENRRSDRMKLWNHVSTVKHRLTKLDKNLFKFKKFLAYLDEHSDKPIRTQDSQKIVQFHAPGYTYDLELLINDSKRILLEVENICKDLTHYTNAAMAMIDRSRERLNSLYKEIDCRWHLIADDTKALSRNVNFVYKVKIALKSE